MNSTVHSQAITRNRLLDLLPGTESERLLTDLKPITLKKKTVLYRAGETVRRCYFPTSGIFSLLSATTAEGKTMQIAMVGSEGMIGVSNVLEIGVTPYEVMAQTDVEALEIESIVLKDEFNRGGKLHQVLLKYIYGLLCQISQAAVCHHFHTVEQRLACWLLMNRDRAQGNSFPVTQEFLSALLGIPRTNVTMTAGTLQQAGLIRIGRGTIEITNEKCLEKVACDCYRTIKRVTEQILL